MEKRKTGKEIEKLSWQEIADQTNSVFPYNRSLESIRTRYHSKLKRK